MVLSKAALKEVHGEALPEMRVVDDRFDDVV
jgi:hypothetical protein